MIFPTRNDEKSKRTFFLHGLEKISRGSIFRTFIGCRSLRDSRFASKTWFSGFQKLPARSRRKNSEGGKKPKMSLKSENSEKFPIFWRIARFWSPSDHGARNALKSSKNAKNRYMYLSHFDLTIIITHSKRRGNSPARVRHGVAI